MDRVLRFAQEELIRYGKAMTGGELSAIRLVVDQKIAKKTTNVVWDDLYEIDVCSAKGEIRGVNVRSVLQGVYRFFRECGCVFVRPGKDGDYIPYRRESECNVNVTCAPTYPFRAITIEGAASLDDVLALIDWSAKNGYNSYFTQFRHANVFFERYYNHERNVLKEGGTLTDHEAAAFVKQISSELKKRGMLYHGVGHGWTCDCIGYAPSGWYRISDEEVPDRVRPYLSLLDGKRKFFRNEPLNSQLCYSSPEVQRRFAESVCTYAQEHPDVDYLHVWLADGSNNFCECENCARKTPSEWYVVLLNAIDEQLEKHGLKTRIVFLLYVDLLWPPVREQLRNPDRFVMMFAPISRSYSESFRGEKYDPEREPRFKPFNLNHNEYPADVRENLEFLYANRNRFSGDAFDFDYHLMWEPYKDLGEMQLARVIYEDVRAFKDLGLDGLVSCQIQKLFAPHGFAQYVMGQTLEDATRPFEDMKETYFFAAFGKYASLAQEVLSVFDCSCCAQYLRHETPEKDEAQARRFSAGAQELEMYAKKLGSLTVETSEGLTASDDSDIIQKTLQAHTATVELSVKILAYYCELCARYFMALSAKAAGDMDKAEALYDPMRRFLFEHEQEFGKYIDSYFFDLMADAKLHDVW